MGCVKAADAGHGSGKDASFSKNPGCITPSALHNIFDAIKVCDHVENVSHFSFLVVVIWLIFNFCV